MARGSPRTPAAPIVKAPGPWNIRGADYEPSPAPSQLLHSGLPSDGKLILADLVLALPKSTLWTPLWSPCISAWLLLLLSGA